MKNLFYLATLLTVAFLLFGCKEKIQPSLPEPAPESDSTQVPGLPLYALQSTGGLSIGNGNDAGYFSISPFIQQEGSGNLAYIDYATRQTVFLCSRPNCAHRDESCTSWLAPGSGGIMPTVIGNKLALVYAGTGQYDTWGAAALPHIETMEFDGSGRRKIAEFKANEHIEKPLFTDGVSLYFRLTTDKESGRTACVMQLDLETGESCQVFALDANRVDWIWGAFDRSVLLYRTKSANGADPFTEEEGYELYLHNIDTGEETHIYEWLEFRDEPTFFDQFLVLCNWQTRHVEVQDLSTGEKVVLEQVELPQNERTDFVIYDYRDGNLLYRVRTWKENRGGIESLNFYTVSKTDRAPHTWNLQYEFSEKAEPVTVVTTLENGWYLVIKGQEFVRSAMQNDDGTPYYSTTPLREFALIKAEDYWAGVANYQNIANYTIQGA